MPRKIERWNGSQLVVPRGRRWNGTGLVGQVREVSTTPASSPGGPLPGASNLVGVYKGGVNAGPGRVPAYETWLGKPVDLTHDMTAQNSWENLHSAGWQYEEWVMPGKNHIYSVGMWPWDLGNATDGAAGLYDHHWTTFGQNLVTYGLTNWFIRLGWEFNGTWFPWTAANQQTQWKTYWRRIVDAVRAVPGCENVSFTWCPLYGYQNVDPMDCWPGDDWVDIVGVDLYDEAWPPVPTVAQDAEARWQHFWGENLYLKWWMDFSVAHGKQFALPEWGLNHWPGDRVGRDGFQGGGLDNPRFIQGVYDALTDPQYDVAYHCYFDVEAGDGYHQISEPTIYPDPVQETFHYNDRMALGDGSLFPQSTALYKQLFGA